jgi:hypothetical protein
LIVAYAIRQHELRWHRAQMTGWRRRAGRKIVSSPP